VAGQPCRLGHLRVIGDPVRTGRTGGVPGVVHSDALVGREGWLRLDDAQHFTEAVTAEIARRLLERQAPPSACTPAALSGASLATDVGAEFVP
jgi:hypothetical protein